MILKLKTHKLFKIQGQEKNIPMYFWIGGKSGVRVKDSLALFEPGDYNVSVDGEKICLADPIRVVGGLLEKETILYIDMDEIDGISIAFSSI